MKLRSRAKSTLVLRLRLRSSARLLFLPRVVAEISAAELEVLIGLVIVAAAPPFALQHNFSAPAGQISRF
jgi:hypothetical protein